jgi:hypothetical protein
MENKKQYIEPLIKLIELNEDKTWLNVFQGLRNGGTLPGGGAGSLNDWGPSYKDKIKSNWYTNLYDILRQLYDNNLPTEKLKEIKSINLRNNIRVIRCLNCNKSYQHPSTFESVISLNFYEENIIPLSKNESLMNLFIPELTFENPKVIQFRNWLACQYEINNIKIYDFVQNKYICPHCNIQHGETEHDLYLINEIDNQKHFVRNKENSNWDNFENNNSTKSTSSWWQIFFKK